MTFDLRAVLPVRRPSSGPLASGSPTNPELNPAVRKYQLNTINSNKEPLSDTPVYFLTQPLYK